MERLEARSLFTVNAALSASTYSVSEGAGTLSVPVILDSALGNDATVAYTVSADSGGTHPATADMDFTATLTGMITFTAGQTTQTISVALSDDALDEFDETFLVSISPGPPYLSSGSPTQATVTLTDNDASPTVALASAGYGPGESAGTQLVVLSLSAESGRDITLNYATGNGTASAGSDYTSASGSLTFTGRTSTLVAGQTALTLTLSVSGDSLDEPDETFTLTISGPDYASLGSPSVSTVTLVDDDPTPTVQFGAAAYSVAENGGSVNVIVTLSAASGYSAVTVDYFPYGSGAVVGVTDWNHGHVMAAGEVADYTPL